MTLNAPSSVIAGSGFQVSYSYAHDKSGGAVAIIPGGPRSIFAVEHPDGVDWFLQQLGAISHAGMSGRSGTATLVAPSTPGQYGLVTVFNPDGGTIDTISLMVTGAPAATPAPTVDQVATLPVVAATSGPVLNPWAAAGAPVYTPPSPEPKASDGATLSAQGADLQSYYVANYGPGMLAATQFVIDHEHQLAAIGQSGTSRLDPCTTAPLITLEQWINKYSTGTQPGEIYAQVMVPDCEEGPARVGINTPVRLAAPIALSAGPGVGGADVGLSDGGSFGGGWGTSTPTVPADRQTGAAPPSVGATLSSLTSNPTLLIGAAAIGALLLFGGKRR